jgi:hypothetical protein
MIRPLGGRLRGSAGDRDLESRLVWLLGSPRSGSSWVFNMLSEHPAVVAINEPLIGDHLAPFLCDRRGVHPADFDRSNFSLRRVRRGASAYFFADEFRNVWQPLLATLMIERFRAHIRRYPAEAPTSETIVLIKEPHGSQAADSILGALPNARLLFLLRDGRDVVDSSLAAAGEGSWLGKAFPMMRGIREDERLDLAIEVAHKWLWRTEVVQEAFQSHPGPKLLLRYENLRERPVAGLGRVLNWLELELDGSELAAVVERHSFERLPPKARGPTQFFRAAAPGMWRENLTDQERTAVERVLGRKLRELGYDA